MGAAALSNSLHGSGKLRHFEHQLLTMTHVASFLQQQWSLLGS